MDVFTIFYISLHVFCQYLWRGKYFFCKFAQNFFRFYFIHFGLWERSLLFCGDSSLLCQQWHCHMIAGWLLFILLLFFISPYISSHFSITHKPWVWKVLGSSHDFYHGLSFFVWLHQVNDIFVHWLQRQVLLIIAYNWSSFVHQYRWSRSWYINSKGIISFVCCVHPFLLRKFLIFEG